MWNGKAERKASTLLARAAVEDPSAVVGIKPSRLARLLGYTVVESVHLPPGRDAVLWSLRSTILIRPGLSEGRREFSIAHELMHALAPKGVPPELLEAYCDRGAAALMMAAGAFMDRATACGWDLPMLNRWYPYCSREAVAVRSVDLLPGAVASGWRGADRKFQRAHLGLVVPDELTELEAFVAAEALDGGSSEMMLDRYLVRGWATGGDYAVTMCALEAA